MIVLMEWISEENDVIIDVGSEARGTLRMEGVETRYFPFYFSGNMLTRSRHSI